MKRIILASASPRRAELLRTIIKAFEIIPADVDESVHSYKPSAAAQELAERKAACVFDKIGGKDVLVIASDTIVYKNGRFFGKPTDFDDAYRMLGELNAAKHYVYTGVCLTDGGGIISFFDRSEVTFKDNSDADIKKYIEKYSPFDKAGAYGIQDGQLVASYKGSLNNIIGLPTEKLNKELARIRL
ncbi:MAG: Maf family protein [Clostridiales bacterium]|nr:Maf family protein [Clostridiales bacterium]